MAWDSGLRERLTDPHDRPRVLATAADFERADRVRKEEGPVRTWFDGIREQGDAILEEPPREYEIPDGLRLLSVSRAILDRVRTLGVLYRFTGEDRYADRAWEEMDAAAGFPDWNPHHFLDTAEMTTALAVGYDWLHDYLGEDRRARLREAIVEKGLKEGLPGYRDTHELQGEGGLEPPTWWVAVDHNWNTVCNGGLSVGALALAGDSNADHDLLSEVVEGARESLELALETLAPNGGWPEGVGYWGYNGRYLAYYLATLESTLGTDLGVTDAEGIDGIGDFPVHLTGADGAFDFGDSETMGWVDEPALHWFGRRFDRPAWSGYQRESVGAAGDVMDLLWYDPDGVPEPWYGDLPLDARFPGAEDAAVFRDGWGTGGAFLGVKAGDNQVNHGDLDLGTFVFDRDGVRWAMDLGRTDYNVPDYWHAGPDGGRWQYYRKRAEGHNLVVVDPDRGPDQDPLATAELERVETGPDEASAVTDLSEAYPATVRRGVRLRGGRRALLVQDEVTSNDPVDVWWFLHTAAEIDVESERATLERDGESLEARIASPQRATFEVRDAEPLPSSPHPEAEAAVEGVRTLAIHLPRVEETTIAVELGDDTGGDLEPLSAW